ncbi:MAG: iron ABC transporter permease [Proteobacteria bacterium]|nr:iron ABC transporter permease [Pseudomonadota bacterium]
MILALHFGPYPIPLKAIWGILAGQTDQGASANTWSVVVLDIRLSRILLSWLIGAGLAMCGVVFQGVLRNPLADPFTLGVSSGGAFGASMAITLGLTTLPGLPGLSALPFAALFGALAALCTVLALGRIGGRLRRETLVLAGIVVATFLSACISLFKALNEESVAAIVFWIMGSLQGRGWEHVGIFVPFFAVGTFFIACYSRELDLLSLGESQARLLGVNSGRARIALLIGASLVTAAAVAVSGIIGFVGLVVPHVVRLIQGGEHRPLLVNSALLGGLLLLWSDVLARTVLSGGAELPVGVVTALLGGPFFCFLLRTRQERTS